MRFKAMQELKISRRLVSQYHGDKIISSIGLPFSVLDEKLDRFVCFCGTEADATLIAQALELQEVKTLEQLKLPIKLSDKVRVIPIEKGEEK